jgi:hypothetical protein
LRNALIRRIEDRLGCFFHFCRFFPTVAAATRSLAASSKIGRAHELMITAQRAQPGFWWPHPLVVGVKPDNIDFGLKGRFCQPRPKAALPWAIFRRPSGPFEHLSGRAHDGRDPELLGKKTGSVWI